MNSISIIIVNYNTKDYLHDCLTSLYHYMPAGCEVIVVDNASSDGSCKMVKRDFPQVNLIQSKENVGFGLGNNLGVQQATGEHIMLFNSDAMLQTDTVTGLLAFMQSHPEVSCVCPRVVLPETHAIQPKTFGFLPSIKTVFMQSTGLNRLFPNHQFFNGIDGDYRWAREMQVGWVSGVCMMMRRDDYLTVSGFDKRFFMYCEDIDLCMKLSKLGKIVLLDDFDIIHIGGASSKNVQAKVRNSVWQQRHLLMIIRDYHGNFQASVAKCIIGLGLSIRLCVAWLKQLRAQFSNKPLATLDKQSNTLFRASLARMKDLLGLKGVNP